MRWASVPSPAQRSAIVDLAERTARARPQLPAVHLAWASALEGAGEQEEALRRLEAACSRFPDDEAVYSACASALGRAGRVDAALAEIERWTGAALLDGRLLTCLSPRGEIAVEGGEAVPIDDCWTRGLAVGPEEIAVGSSLYGKRVRRVLLPGFVTFLDRDYRRTARLYLPAAPTQIRAIGFDPFPSGSEGPA